MKRDAVEMLDYLGGTPRKLDLGFVPAPSGGGLTLFQQEEVHECYMVMIGYAPSMDSPERQQGCALVTATGFRQSVFGYPNEEAYWKDPRGRLGHGFYELVDSSWSDNVNEYNQRSFGEPLFKRPRPTRRARHFFIGSKDASCQVLAVDLEVEVFPNETFGVVAKGGDDEDGRLGRAA